jgi:hypothetical protein
MPRRASCENIEERREVVSVRAATRLPRPPAVRDGRRLHVSSSTYGDRAAPGAARRLRLDHPRGAIDDPTGDRPGSRAGTCACASTDARTCACTDANTCANTDTITGTNACADPGSDARTTRERLRIDRGQREPDDVNRVQSQSDQRGRWRVSHLAQRRQHNAHVHWQQRRVEFRSDPTGRIV